MFWVGRAYNLSDEQVGELLTKLEERHFKPLSPIVQKGIRKLLKRRFVQKLLKKIAVNSQKFSEEYPYAYGIPYYRNEVIGYGDEKCANLFKIDADIITDNWLPHGIRNDGLK